MEHGRPERPACTCHLSTADEPARGGSRVRIAAVSMHVCMQSSVGAEQDLLASALAGGGRWLDVVGPHLRVGLHVVLAADVSGAAQGALHGFRARYPGVRVVVRDDVLRAVVPVPSAEPVEIRRTVRGIAERYRWAAGFSAVRADIDSRGLAEAEVALRVAQLFGVPAALGYESLGAYRYLAPLLDHIDPDEEQARAVASLVDYDQRRGTQLLETLDCVLDRRGSAVAAARDLTVHVNTVRQRLNRIKDLTGVGLAGQDLTELSLAVKLGRLRLDARLWRARTMATSCAVEL